MFLECHDIYAWCYLMLSCCHKWFKVTVGYFVADRDECLSNPCQNGGTCVDHMHRYFCRCDSGYSGEHCERRTLLSDITRSPELQYTTLYSKVYTWHFNVRKKRTVNRKPAWSTAWGPRSCWVLMAGIQVFRSPRGGSPLAGEKQNVYFVCHETVDGKDCTVLARFENFSP